MRRHLTLLTTAALGTALAQSDPPQTLTWGAYTVHITPRPEGNGDQTATATIRQGSKTLVTVKEWNISASLKSLRPGGRPELVLEAYSGGAHCCTTYYAFTQDLGPVQNLFILDAGNYGARFANLNGDGTQELVFDSDTYAYYDYSFADSPSVRFVLGWDGLRVADLTRRYAYVPTQAAASYLKELLAPDTTEPDARKSRLVGYLTNSVVAGSGAQAEQTLNTQVFSKDPNLRAWYASHRSELLGALYDDPGARLSISDAKTLPEPQKP